MTFVERVSLIVIHLNVNIKQKVKIESVSKVSTKKAVKKLSHWFQTLSFIRNKSIFAFCFHRFPLHDGTRSDQLAVSSPITIRDIYVYIWANKNAHKHPFVHACNCDRVPWCLISKMLTRFQFVIRVCSDFLRLLGDFGPASIMRLGV